MNIFFLSSSYMERTFLEFFSHSPLNGSVILLKQNHPEVLSDYYGNVRFMTFEDALDSADFVYIMNDGRIPISTIQKCKKAVNKNCYIDNIPPTKLENKFLDFIRTVTVSPVVNNTSVLLLQLGVFSQIERVELELSRGLTDRKIDYNLFSLTNSSLLIEKMNQLAGTSSLEKVQNNNSISIVSVGVDILGNINTKTDNSIWDNFIRGVRPDYLILSCENDFDNIEEINDYFRIRYSKSIDCFAYSEYISYRQKRQRVAEVFVNEHPLLEVSIDDIISKLAFPAGIKIISR